MQKTLGGDRLGSGKKMKVNLHGYERSTHDLGYLFRSTMAAGTLVPFTSQVALPGDTFDINLHCDVKTHPTIGPLFGSYKVQLDIFLAPVRLYQGMLHNNALGIGRNMSQVKLPLIQLIATDVADSEDLDNSQVNPSSLLAYLGIRGVGIAENDDIRKFNAVPILAYWEIYKNYYANKQEEIGAVLHTPAVALIATVDDITVNEDNDPLPQAPTESNIFVLAGNPITINYTGARPLDEQIIIKTQSRGEITLLEYTGGTDIIVAGTLVGNATFSDYIINWRYRDAGDLNPGKPAIVTFDLSNIDDMRTEILKAPHNTAFIINTPGLEPYNFLTQQPNGIPNVLSSQEGLGLKTYQSDLFNNWLSTEWIDGTGGITEVTAIDTTGGSFTLDTLNLSKKVYNMLNRIAVSGGSYRDWQDAVYDHNRHREIESPMYMGGLIKELVFQEVVSNSAAEGTDGSQPLGTLAGKGVMSKKHKGGNIVIKADEISYIIGIVSLTPRIDYSQGNNWDVNLLTLDDFHKPALDEIGFQELITEQMAWWDTRWNGTAWETQSAGKQPAWINYMTNVNKNYGNFAITNNEMFMTLNRRYEHKTPLIEDVSNIEDLTTYIDPSKFNFIFAETQLDAQNFWVQIAVDITARRKMSAKIMPNL